MKEVKAFVNCDGTKRSTTVLGTKGASHRVAAGKSQSPRVGPPVGQGLLTDHAASQGGHQLTFAGVF